MPSGSRSYLGWLAFQALLPFCLNGAGSTVEGHWAAWRVLRVTGKCGEREGKRGSTSLS